MIILDTCAIIYDALVEDQLTTLATKELARADQNNALIVSDISFLELAMLVKKGKLEINSKVSEFINLYLQSRNISVIPMSPEIAELAMSFDASINNDPADRIISATSIIHNARLITSDKNLRKSASAFPCWTQSRN